jgi:hypothetical protein
LISQESLSATRPCSRRLFFADICRDLGITGSHQLWRELHWAITYQGGDYVRLVSDIIARTGRRIAKAWPAAAPPPSPAAAGTGPP